MPKGYQHLTYEQRCQIYVLLKRGESIRGIARALEVSSSTISREIKRNSGKKGYRFKQAHNKTLEKRNIASSKPLKFMPEVRFIVEYLLSEK